MKNQKRPSDHKNRKDHYSPQGYLRGFIHPDREAHPKPLWVLDVVRKKWVERSPSQVAWGRGFYDYSEDGLPDATADQAFSVFENQLPRVRNQIRTEGYRSWNLHRQFLVAFAAMMAARSPLFRIQSVSTVEPSLAQEPTGAALAKNYSITLMRSEMRRRAAEWERFDWVLSYTTNPEEPFVTSDQPVGMRGAAADQRIAWDRNDFWLWCPLSWDMCLIASSQPLRSQTTSSPSREHLAEIRLLTAKQARNFVASPCVLAHLSELPASPRHGQ
jgi:hypothetical protein